MSKGEFKVTGVDGSRSEGSPSGSLENRLPVSILSMYRTFYRSYYLSMATSYDSGLGYVGACIMRNRRVVTRRSCHY